MSAPYSGLRLGLILLTSVPDTRLPLRLILAFVSMPLCLCPVSPSFPCLNLAFIFMPLCLHPISASFLRLTLAVVPVPNLGFVSRACSRLALRLSLPSLSCLNQAYIGTWFR